MIFHKKTSKTLNEAWYLLHVFPGLEIKIKDRLEQQSSAENMQPWVTKIIIPQVEARNKGERTLFSGWVILKMRMDSKIWNKIRNLPGVTGFVGAGQIPTPFNYQDWREIQFSRFTQ